MKQSSYVCIINLSRETVLFKNLYQLHKPVFPHFHFPQWWNSMSIKNLRPQPGSKEKFVFFSPVLLWVGTPRTANPTLKPVGLTRLPFFTRLRAAALIEFFTPQMRRAFEGGVYLKVDATKNCINHSIIISLLILFWVSRRFIGAALIRVNTVLQIRLSVFLDCQILCSGRLGWS